MFFFSFSTMEPGLRCGSYVHKALCELQSHRHPSSWGDLPYCPNAVAVQKLLRPSDGKHKTETMRNGSTRMILLHLKTEPLGEVTAPCPGSGVEGVVLLVRQGALGVCTHVGVCVCVCTRVWVCASVCAHVWVLRGCVHTCVGVCVCVCTRVGVCVCVCTRVPLLEQE